MIANESAHVPRIVVVGSLNMDFVLRAPRIPLPGETVLGGADLQTIPGGKGANQALAAARMGGAVSMIGRVGGDAFGEQLRNNLDSAGVDIDGVIVNPDSASGIALVVVDDRGQNSIVVSSGANSLLTPADIDDAAKIIEGSDVLIMQLEVPQETVTAAARCARARGVRTVLNPAPAQTLSEELLEVTDVIIPNETEVGTLTGIEVHSDRNIAQAVESIRALGVPTIIITRGSSGSTIVTADQIGHVPAFNVEPVDTTACGDAFVAAFSVAFAEGATMPDAVRRGNAAGALAATIPGAQPSLPTRAAVEELVKRSARPMRNSTTTTRIDDG